MKLGDLTKKLYDKESKLSERKLADDAYDATNEEQPKDDFAKIEREVLNDQQGLPDGEKKTKFLKGKLIIFALTLVGILVGIVLLVFGYYRFVGSAFSEERVLIEIDGPEEVQSAEDITYTVRVINNNRVDLNNCHVKLSYPNEMILDKKDFMQVQGFNSARVEIGQIKSREEKKFEVSFESFGPRDRQVYLNASLTYQPTNFSSDFDKSIQKSVLIKSSPISLTIVPLQQAASGELVEVEVIIKNESTKKYGNLEMRLDYPEGFTFTTSDIAPIKDNRIWKIDSLSAKDQKKITVRGIVEGMPESLKKFVATIGETRDDDKFLTFTEIEGSVKIVPSRVEIIQKIRNTETVYAGSEVFYTINFKNTSDVALRDLVLTEFISSEVMNTARLDTKGGYYDSGKQAIIWRAAQIPKLKLLQPQEGGEVSFIVKIMDNFPMKNEYDKNYTIKSFTELESLDVNSPLWQNKKIISPERIVKINSKLILSPTIVYDDDEIANSGPIPPKVGTETTFAVKWRIMNTSNDLKNVIVKTSLLPGVVWKNKLVPNEVGMEFNERTNELHWKIGTLDAGTGFISPVKNISFQIGILASENQVGSNIDIIDKVKVEALDAFTGNEVHYEFRNLGLHDISESKGTIEPAD